MFLAFAGGFKMGSASAASNVWPIPFTICLCMAVAGGMMLFFPDRAFKTENKPRWLGLPLLFVGLIGAFQWLMLGFS